MGPLAPENLHIARLGLLRQPTRPNNASSPVLPVLGAAKPVHWCGQQSSPGRATPSRAEAAGPPPAPCRLPSHPPGHTHEAANLAEQGELWEMRVLRRGFCRESSWFAWGTGSGPRGLYLSLMKPLTSLNRASQGVCHSSDGHTSLVLRGARFAWGMGSGRRKYPSTRMQVQLEPVHRIIPAPYPLRPHPWIQHGESIHRP